METISFAIKKKCNGPIRANVYLLNGIFRIQRVSTWWNNRLCFSSNSQANVLLLYPEL